MANQNFKVKKGLEVGTGVTISDGNINISGIITAQFKGDGSALTGVTAAGSGVVVQEEGSNIGTAATINFIGSSVTAALSGGIANVTVTGGGDVVSDTTPQLGGNLDLNSKDITGTGNISITGGFNATGVSTFQENVVFQTSASFGDNDKINVGTSNDLQIFHDGTTNIISDAVGAGISLVGNTKVVGVLTATGGLRVPGGTGVSNRAEFGNNQEFTLQYNTVTTRGILTAAANGIDIQATTIKLLPNVGENGVIVNQNGSVELYHDNSKKFETTGVGVTVFGTTQTQQLNASGVSTFSGTTNFNGFNEFNGNAQFDGNVDFYDSVEFKGTSGASSVHMYDENAIHFGDHNDGKIIYNNTGNIIKFQRSGSAGEIEINATPITLKHTSNTKLQTTSTGVVITGVATATSFSGSGSALTGLTGASAGTYGASTNTPIITVDSNGRVTGIATVATSGAGGGGGISNIVEDTTPQLGGNLDLNSKSITGTGNIEITGYAGVSGVSTFSGAVGFATHIHDAGTGGLDIRTNLLRIKNDADSETLATFAEDGAVSFYHDNALRLATTNTGVSITDNLNVAGVSTFTGNVILNANLDLQDNDKILLGTGDDLQIYHDENNSYIDDTGTGRLNIRGNTGISLRNYSNNNQFINCYTDGTVELFYNNSKKLETTNTGATVTGTLAATAVTGDGSGLTNLPAPGISTASSNIQVNFDVTANGSGAYRFTGPGNDAADDNPDLYLIRGQRYRFTNNSGGSHPFQIRSAAGGSAYSTGVTNNGGASGNIDFNVQHDAPSRLYYQCTSHSAMVGNIYITGGANWQTTSVNTSTAEEIFTLNSVGIGTNNPSELLHLQSGHTKQILKSTNLNTASSVIFDVANVNTADFLLGQLAGRWNGTDVAYINFEAGADTTNKDDGIITFLTSASGGSPTERLRIDTSGRLLVGTSTAVKNANRLSGNKIALVGTGLNYPSTIITSYATANADAGPIIEMQKSRGETDGSMTIVADNDRLGTLQFLGSDGTNFIRGSAITAYVDGTPGTNDMPGRLSFQTTSDGASSPTERFRITSSGVPQFTTTGTQYASATVPAFVVNSNGDHALVLNNKNTSDPRGLFIYQDQDVNNETSYFLRARAGGTDRAHLYSNGTLQLHSGNLKVASGNGIDFSATTNATGMTSELLDDYEEGTWTPTMTGATLNTQYTPGNSYENRYVKIGRQVTIEMNCSWSTITGATELKIGGIPFTADNGLWGGGLWYNGWSGSQPVDLMFWVGGNTTYLKFYTATNGGVSALNQSAISTGGNIYGYVTYFV